MCGIAGGVWDDPNKSLPQEVLQAMVDVLRHRGPDDEGHYRAEIYTRQGYESPPGVALGHRRLAVIDRAGGHQPMASPDEQIWVVFNGEIYNFPALRNRIEGAGHALRTRSDTETLIYLYLDEGPSFVRHLRGMFALAVWDARVGQLTLARDRLGKKPLFYRLEDRRLLFASEIKALLQVPGVPRELSPQALDEYLTYQYIPHPHTIFSGISKLPPAHYAVYRRGQLQLTRYWQPAWDKEEDVSAISSQTKLRELLTNSVRMRLQSDVPLGAWLSGGIDSTIIAGLAQQETGQKLQTFSIGFSEPEYDETEFARGVSQKLNTEHHEEQLNPAAWELLPQLAWHFDEPFGDSSALAVFALSKMTRGQVTVTLTGDGGDELFAGYDRYRAVRLANGFDRLPVSITALVAHSWWQLLPGQRPRSWLRRFKRFSEALGMPPGKRYLRWMSVFDEEMRAELYTDEFIQRLPAQDPAWFLRECLAPLKSRDAVTAASLGDLVSYLTGDLMVKTDMASMAFGLECRCPFLDHELVEWAATLPSKLKLRGRQGKRILRETFADLLPDAVNKRRKMGFGIPLSPWFRGPWLEPLRETLLSTQAQSRGYFRPQAVEQLIQEHTGGLRDHSYRLWALLMLENWQRAWLDPAILAPTRVST